VADWPGQFYLYISLKSSVFFSVRGADMIISTPLKKPVIVNVSVRDVAL
jgi:hypothetical protein